MSITGLGLLCKELLLELLYIAEILVLNFVHLLLVLDHALKLVMLQLRAQRFYGLLVAERLLRFLASQLAELDLAPRSDGF